MRSLDSSAEASTITAIRRADASLSFSPDVEVFAALLALEPDPAPLPVATSLGGRAKAGRLWLRRGLVGTTVVATLSGSAVAMAQGAQPGSDLYGIKRASESLWLATSVGPQDRASRLLGLAERRAQEVIVAEKAGHHQLALEAATAARHDIKAAQELAPSLSPKDRGQVDERARNEEQRVTTILGKDEAQSHDQHNGGEANPGGPGTPTGGATGSSGGSQGQQGTATTPPGGGTGSSGGTPEPQETATAPPSANTGSSGGSQGQRATVPPPSGASTAPGQGGASGGAPPPAVEPTGTGTVESQYPHVRADSTTGGTAE